MRFIEYTVHLLDYLGGARPDPPRGLPLLESPWTRGLWWALLAAAIILFCGQSSRFIYIDF